MPVPCLHHLVSQLIEVVKNKLLAVVAGRLHRLLEKTNLSCNTWHIRPSHALLTKIPNTVARYSYRAIDSYTPP